MALEASLDGMGDPIPANDRAGLLARNPTIVIRLRNVFFWNTLERYYEYYNDETNRVIDARNELWAGLKLLGIVDPIGFLVTVECKLSTSNEVIYNGFNDGFDRPRDPPIPPR